MKTTIDILVSLDQNYIPQLQVMLTSLYLNNPETRCGIYLLHRGIPQTMLDGLQRGLEPLGYSLHPICVDDTQFAGAPVSGRYPQEMYYRLLAAQLLPDDLERILYLDPDILVINSLKPLWDMDLGSCLFAAAAHTGKTELANNVNRLRLGTEQNYYNSGVLLMDLAGCRRDIVPADIFSYVEVHAQELVLPDQDILNALYGNRILEIDDAIWNYDARNYSSYLMRSYGQDDIQWVMQHTAILHFCGKAKPWKPNYRHRFGVLYLHYSRLAEQFFPMEAD